MARTDAFRNRKLWLALLLALQTLFLLGLAASYYAIGWLGQEIRLKTVPVDPRDFLYGDYVTLSYEISNLDPQLWKDAEKPKRGSSIYVVLKPSGSGLYEPAAASTHKPDTGSEEVVIKGVVQYDSDIRIAVDYGIERYFVPEGTGKELEEKARNMVVIVKVAPWGQARITGMEP